MVFEKYITEYSMREKYLPRISFTGSQSSPQISGNLSLTAIQLILKNLILELVKNMIRPPLIWLMYSTLWCIWLCAFSRHTTEKLIAKPHLSQWFDIKCSQSIEFQMQKKKKWKTSGNIFWGHLGEWDFNIFPRPHLIMGETPDTF